MEPVLLLHGALGSAAQFDALHTEWASDGQVLTADFPGHGDAQPDGPFSTEAFAQAMLQLLDARDICRPVVVFGYSMGGYVALRMALRASQRPRAIVTLGTKFDWRPEVAEREAQRSDADQIAEALARRHRTQDWRAVVRQTADLLRRLGAGEALGEAELRRITCPVCIGLGECDRMVSPEESEQAARWLPRGRFERLPGIPHPIEQVPIEVLAPWLRTSVERCLG